MPTPPSISVTETIGQIYTKDYGTIKLDWVISNPDGNELVSLVVARTVYSAKTVTLTSGLGFNPIDPNGSWTDTGLALAKDATADRSITYTLTLKYLDSSGAEQDATPVVENLAVPHLRAFVTSPSEDYCTDECWDFGSKKAYATFEGKASLSGENGTTLVLTSTLLTSGEPTTVRFITDSSTAPGAGGGYFGLNGINYYKIGTNGASTDELATEAIHRAFSVYWDEEFIPSPASYTDEKLITLTQPHSGAIGNTEITGTLSAAVHINGLPFNKDATVYTGFKGGRTGSDLGVSLGGYFENPLTQRSSFDINYCLNNPNSDGIGDAEFYLNLPKEANITSFVPNSIISSSDVSAVEASEGAPEGMSNRWKVSIAYPGSGTVNFGQGSPSSSTKATALFAGKSAINNDTGKTLIIQNTDGSLVTFTTAAAAPSASSATTIGTTSATTDVLATEAFHTAFAAAITAGTLKATLTPAQLSGSETSFTLTQDIVGTIGNTTFTGNITAAHLHINGAVWATGTSAYGATGAGITDQTPGAPANAYAVFAPMAAIENDNNTDLSIFNDDGSYAFFKTSSGTEYGDSYNDGNITFIGTKAIAADGAKAGKAIHAAFTEAIAAGKLKSYHLLPKVHTNENAITLINKTAGSAGNKKIIGNIDSSSLKVNGNYFNVNYQGGEPLPSFGHGTNMPPLESPDISKLLPPSYGKFGTVYIDKPLGDGFVSFDTENTKIQVIPEKLPSLYFSFNSDLSSTGVYRPTVTTLSGTPAVSSTEFNRGWASLSFNGSSGINIPDTTGATDLDGDFTIDFWVRRTNQSNNDFLIGSGGTYGASTANQWALSCNATTLTLHYNPAGTWINHAITTTINTTTWEHIAVVRSANEVKVYVGGTLEDTITSNISSMSFDYSGINIGQPMVNGTAAGHGDELTGYINDFKVIKGAATITGSGNAYLEDEVQSPTTNAIYDGTGNMNNKKGSVVFGQVKDSTGIVDTGSSFGAINRSSTDYFWLPIDTDYSPDNIWQTGPPLSKCVDEVNIGYGDHSYSLKAFDSNTFDIEYCLKTDEMDTFIILCAMTDFKTKIAAVEKQFGDAADNGWDINFKNLSPGFGIIYGHGTKKIKPSGMGTLLRVYLDSPLIQQNPSTDPDTSVCTYPAFLNLGESNYRQFQQYISEVDTESATRLLDSNSSLWTQLSGDFQWDGTVLTSDRLDGSGIVKELRWLAWGSDPRLGSVATTLADNIERVLKEYSTDTGQEAVISNAVAAGHYFRIFFMVYLNLIRTLPSVQEKLDFTWSKLRDGATSLCDFSLSWGNTDDNDYCSSDDNELVIYIYYKSIFSATSGIEIDFTELKDLIATESTIALSDANSWGRKKYNLSNSQLDGSGDDDATDQSYVGAYDGEFIQAYNDATGKYLAVYDAQILSQNIQTLNNPYLQNTTHGTSITGGGDILTTIVLDVTGNCSSISSGLMDSIVAAIDTDLATAKLVGNEIIAKPSSELWTGNSYNVGDNDSLDIKDFLTTAMFALHGFGTFSPTTALTEAKIESIFKLPKSALKADGTHKTVKQYYNIANLDLSGVDGEYISENFDTIDANGDGKIDISDVVALRNTWVLKDEYPTTSSASVNSGLSVVPTEKCVSVNSDINLLLPTNCSTFCVTPSCFAKVWLSDLIAVYSEEDAGDGTARIPEKYLAEVSYSVDCEDASGIVEDFSGVQFKLEGLKRNGILRTENGSEDGSSTNATAVKIANWTEHLVNSTVDEAGLETKDTYFAYSVTGDYISKGSGVLCYLSLPSDSMLNADESMARESFLSTTTNKAISTFSNSIEGVDYPLANVRFKSFHIDELEIFEKFGLKVSNTKITSNKYMTIAADSGWLGYAGVAGGDLFHFDDNLNEAGGGTAGTIGGATGTVTYESQFGGMGATFGKQIHFVNSVVSGGKYFKYPDPLVGTGAFTLEFFYNLGGTPAAGDAFIGSGTKTGPPFDYWIMTIGDIELELTNSHAGTVQTLYFDYDPSVVSSTMKHFVLMRSDSTGTGSTGSTWHMWVDGNYIAMRSGGRTTYSTDFTTADWILGGEPATTPKGNPNIYLDEMLLTKSAAYSTEAAISGNITPPSVPLGVATVTEASIKTALAHAATGIYNAAYDSDGDGVVDIADIQALAHLLYDVEVFSANKVTPRECCPYVAPSIPNLVLVDFKDGTIPLIVEGAKNTIEIDIDGNELDCTSALSGHEGGIFLHWNPVDNADYYIVYRQEANKKPIPIIASAPGGTRAYLKDFTKRERGYSNTPTQLATTTWIDFPPALTSGCLDYSKGGSSAAAPPGSSGVVDDTLSKYKYWIDAVNKDGQTTSHKIIGSAVSCRYAPTCTDFNIIVKSDSTHYGEFQAAHPFAPAPIGGCYSDSSQSASGDCLPVWVFAQNSQSGDGHKATSDKKGTITTDGRMPNSQGLGGKNELGFNYIPKKGYVGEDKFRYTAIVKDSENPNNIELWCRNDATVSVYVKPKSPILTGLVEPCCSDDEGKIKLTWAAVDGAESYIVYKGGTKVSTITDDGSKDVIEYKEEPTEYAALVTACGSNSASTTALQYKVSATKYMSGTTYESDSNVVDLTLTCCDPLANPTITSSLRGFCDKPLDVSGIVTLTLSAIAGADYYNIYRRGSYTGSSSDPFEFVGRAEGTLEFEDQVQGCIGCPSTNVKYDYYAVSMQEEYPDCNTEGNVATVTINCCNTAPVAYDQSLEVDYETELSGQILDVIDPEGNIKSTGGYTFNAVSDGTVTSDADTGEFSFVPDDGFYTAKDGTVTFTWTATDDCTPPAVSNIGTVTITVKSPPECLEYDYIICNANIPWLTEQQDTDGVRKKISSLQQVPFMLNIKGPPSLRSYYGAYTMTANAGANSNTKGTGAITIANNSNLLGDVITIITPAGTEITTTATNDPSTGAGEDDSTFEIKSTAPETADEIADVLDKHPEIEVVSEPGEPTVNITMVADGPGSDIELDDPVNMTSTHEDGVNDPLPPTGAPDDDGGFGLEGCTDSNYMEYDPLAMHDDGSCSVLKIYGCMDENANNYSASANVNEVSANDSSNPCVFGLTPTALFHFNGNLTQTCAGGDVSASGTFVSDSSGKFSTAAKFGTSGSDFHINTDAPTATDNTNSLYWDGEFVFDMWVKIDDVDENGTIIMPDSTDAGAGLFGLEWLATGAWKLFLGASTELIIADADVADDGTAGTWYHVGITRDGDEKIKFYRDGVGKDMVIPVHGNALYHLDGDVDDSLASADGTATAGCTYSTSGALAGFGQYLNITNPTWNANDATNYAEFPMPLGVKGTAGSGLGAFTLEWFMDASGAIPGSSQKQSFVADAVFWNSSTGTPNPPEGWHFFGYKTWYGSSFMSVLLEQHRGTATDMCRWDYDFTEAGVSGFKHYALVRGVSSGGNSTWRLYIDGWFKDVASGNSTTMTTVDSGVIASGNNHEKWYIGKRNGVYYTDYGVKDVSFDEVRVTLNDTIYIGTDSSVQAFAPPTAAPHSDSGATHTSEDGYEHATTINPNGTNASGTGYEVGGASDTPFEGSIDELRIVKGESEEITEPDDEYDCS